MLFVVKDAIAGDLGLGAGPMTNGWKASSRLVLYKDAIEIYRDYIGLYMILFGYIRII